MLKKICMLGDPVLRKKAEDITVFDDKLNTLIADMIETMDSSNGIGLAAPQIGESLNLFVLRNYLESEDGETRLSDPEIYINPKITYRSQEVDLDEEGCLSIPGVRAEVYRPWIIEIEAFNQKGEPFKQRIEGFNARVRLHEFDHLQGTLFIDLLSKHERKKIKSKLQAIETNTQKNH
jgi:peptide deformylase